MKEKKNEMFNTMHLNEVKKMLGVKGEGFRTVIAWCKKNKIIVFGQGKMKRILESDWINIQKIALVKAAHESGLNIKSILKDKGIDLEEITLKKDVT